MRAEKKTPFPSADISMLFRIPILCLALVLLGCLVLAAKGSRENVFAADAAVGTACADWREWRDLFSVPRELAALAFYFLRGDI